MRKLLQLTLGKITDYEGFISVFSEVESIHREHLPRKYKKPVPLFSKDDFEMLLKGEDSKLTIAKIGDSIVGFAIAFLKHSPSKNILQPRVYVELDSICVSKKYRKRGIGKALLQDIESWAANIGVLDIQLNVRAFNEEARSFYQKHGYDSVSFIMRKCL